MIRVLIADDHAVVRRGLVNLLAEYDDIDVVAVASNGADALAFATEHRPDVALIDLAMPDLSGIEVTRRLAQTGSEARAVILTGFADRDGILAALDAGAAGYLLKDAEPDELVRGIRAAAAGDAPLAAKAARTVLDARAGRDPLEQLSPREREVLRLVATGLPNKLVARRLGLSESTVKTHITSIFRTIGVDDRTQAAIWAARHGLTED